MYQQTNLLVYKFRVLFAGLFALGFLIAISAVVTAIGSHSVLNPKSGISANTADASLTDTPNTVATGIYSLAGSAQSALLAVGTTLYQACASVNSSAMATGHGIANGSAAIVHGTWHGVAFAGHTVGSGVVLVGHGIRNGTLFSVHGVASVVMFTVHLPGRAIGSITSGSSHAVDAVIKPADASASPIPVITAPSAATLARMTTQERQEIASAQATQIAANQALGGAILAGDPTHGGYPAKWDNIAQDSTIDSWGMYNRECVSYAAWKVYQTYGTMPFWGGVGNANEWPGDARRAGIPTGSTPQARSVAISMHGYYGHAMWVEKVQGDMIYVSQYNYDLHGHYSEMWVKGSYFTYIYFK